MLRRHGALFLEGGAAEIKAVPTALQAHGGNGAGFRLVVFRLPLVDPGIVAPIGIDADALLLQPGQHREGVEPGDSQKVHAHPGGGKGPAHMADDGQEVRYAEIMIDEKYTGRPALQGALRVLRRLLIVQDMDHRQHDRAADAEHLVECGTVHCAPPRALS